MHVRLDHVTLDLHISLSQGSTALSFHLRRTLPVSVLNVILGRPGPVAHAFLLSARIIIGLYFDCSMYHLFVVSDLLGVFVCGGGGGGRRSVLEYSKIFG